MTSLISPQDIWDNSTSGGLLWEWWTTGGQQLGKLLSALRLPRQSQSPSWVRMAGLKPLVELVEPGSSHWHWVLDGLSWVDPRLLGVVLAVGSL